MTIKLDFVCDIDTAAGYSAHARLMIKAFHEVGLHNYGIDLKVTGRRKEHSVVEIPQDEVVYLNKYLGNVQGTPDVRVFFEPAQWVTFDDPDVKVVNFCQWETTSIRSWAPEGQERLNWVAQMNKCDMVMTSCHDARQAYIDSGVTTDIAVVTGPIFPFNYDVGVLDVKGLVKSPKSGEVRKWHERPVVVGYMAQWTPRKNVEAFIRDFTIAFAGRSDVVGLLKTYKSGKFDDEDQVLKAAKIVRDTCRIANPPDIYMVTDKLTDEQVQQFFNVIDVYYCASRGEGFNMPAAFAAAAGKPVIATRYGGHKEFLPDGLLCNGSFSPCLGMGTYDATQYWVNIDERESMAKLRKIVDYVLQFKQAPADQKPKEYPTLMKAVSHTANVKANPKVFVENFVNAIKRLVEGETTVVEGQASVCEAPETTGVSRENS